MPDFTMKELKTELESFKGTVQNTVKELINNGKEETSAEVTALKAKVTEAEDSLKNLNEKIKESEALHIPGLKDELEKKSFSWTSFIRALYNRSNHNAPGHYNPWEEAGAEYEKEIVDQHMKKRDASADDGSSGGYLVPEEVSSEIIGLAMDSMPIMDMGVTKLTGLYGNLPVPKLTARQNSYWVGENQKPTKGNNTFGQVTLRPKKAGAFTKQSNRLIYQSRGVSDMAIKQALGDSLRLKVHEGIVQGTGSEHQPKGIIRYDGFSSNDVSMGSNGRRFKIDDASDLELALEVATELNDTGEYGYLMRPEIRSGMKREKVKQYSTQDSEDGMPIMAINPLINNKQLEDILGYKLRTTTHIPLESLGTSDTVSDVIFGNWKLLWVGFWRDLEIKVSDTASDGSTGSAFLEDQLYIVGFQEVDCAVMRESAFSKVNGAETKRTNW